MLRIVLTRRVIASPLTKASASCLLTRDFAGHSKWANIRHRKGAADAKRAKLFVKLCAAVASASQKCSGDTENFLLASAINKAKLNNVPKVNIEAAVERGANGKSSSGEMVTYEGIGPGGISVIVEALTDNRKRTAPQMRAIFSKHGGSLGAEGSVTWQFDRLGCCRVPTEKIDSHIDHIFVAAIDAGACDVEFLEEQSDPTSYRGESEGKNSGHSQVVARIVCAPVQVAKVRDGLAAAGYPPTLVEFVWQIKEKSDIVELDEDSETFDFFGDFLAALDDNDDVQSIFHNGPPFFSSRQD